MEGVGMYLRRLVEMGGGELHLSPGQIPRVRVGGRLQALDGEPASPADIGEAMLKLAPPARSDLLKRTGTVEFAAEVDGVGRFRVGVLRERLGTGAVARLVPCKVVEPERLALPHAALELCRRLGGLVMVAGPAGSGKTTTLAAMLDIVNRERAVCIVTLEDPIEFIHVPQRGLVRQIEVGIHCEGFPAAVRAAARAGAEAILLGRVPDARTAEAAMEAAASGILVLAEVPAQASASAIERVLGLFGADMRDSARAALASSLAGVVVQRLLPRAEGSGLVAAFEVLVSTRAVAGAIREAGAIGAESAIQAGALAGMKLLDDALVDLVASGTVALAEASARSADPEGFRAKCAAAGTAPEAASPEHDRPVEKPARPASGETSVTSLMPRRLTRAEVFANPSIVRPGDRLVSKTAAFAQADAEPPAYATADRAAGPADQGADAPLVAGRKVLVVDDDAQMRDMLVQMLGRAGARVEAVGEPRQALARIESGAYDLAMFDILMPEVSGMELYDQVIGVAPSLKERVVFVTACNPDVRLQDRIATRGGRLLRKPFVVDELLKAAAAAIRAENPA